MNVRKRLRRMVVTRRGSNCGLALAGAHYWSYLRKQHQWKHSPGWGREHTNFSRSQYGYACYPVIFLELGKATVSWKGRPFSSRSSIQGASSLWGHEPCQPSGTPLGLSSGAGGAFCLSIWTSVRGWFEASVFKARIATSFNQAKAAYAVSSLYFACLFGQDTHTGLSLSSSSHTGLWRQLLLGIRVSGSRHQRACGLTSAVIWALFRGVSIQDICIAVRSSPLALMG